MDTSNFSPTRKLAGKVIFAAFNILKEKGGECAGREIVAEIEKRTQLDEWAKTVYEKTGNVRWRSILHFYSIDCIKAEYLIKKKGIWYLTKEGERAIQLGEVGLLEAASAAYRKWNSERIRTEPEPTDDEDDTQQEQEATIHEVEQQALDGLKKHIFSLNGYEFQDLVAALLHGMGYFTPFVAPRGKDGGIDVIAYRDPIGTVSPRIKIQIKHRKDIASSVDEIRQLMGLLQRDGDVGIFVSTGGFTSDAKHTARSSHVHVELIDLDRFVSLWQEFYLKMNDEDKNLLPLKPIYFHSPSI